jgi:acyl carrier protein
VEIVVAVQKGYDVRIGAEDTSREVLRSIATLADFIRRSRM